jgi:glycosyltransferase involved in cell wall biosynthesis
MKILHVCDSIVGGTGTYLSELLPYQISRYGADNIILLMPEEHLPYLESALIDQGICLEFFHRPSRLTGLANLYRKFRGLRKRFAPDIVHAHSSGAGLISRIFLRHRTYKLVFCAHGWSFDISGNRLMRSGLRMMERALALRADRVIAISQHEFDRALEVGIAKDKLVLIRNAIARVPPKIAPAQWVDDRLKILFAGRFDRQKGLDILLEAIKPLGDKVTVRVIGEPVVNRANPTIPLPFVEYYGWRNRPAIGAQMMAADILILPSRWEGFGLVAIEAMRLSLPVAAASVGGLTEILGNGEYGFMFPPSDPIALRQCLESITPERLEEMRHVGHDRFLSVYTSERLMREMDDLYTSLVHGNR